MHRVPLGRHAQVDLTDQLRGSYRPDRFMRQKKWWWSIYIWTVGTACTAAFITYNKVCAAHGIPKKKRMNHLRFQAKLAQQLCCPDKRVCPVQDGPRTSPRKHKQKASTASAPSASSGAGVGKAIRLSETRLQHVRASYASSASGHLPTCEPPMGANGKSRLDCQMCVMRASARGERSQVKSVIMCSGCTHLVCGPKCWCDLHGITP